MWLWRNPEIRKYGNIYVILALLAAAGAGFCFGVPAALYVAVFSIAGAVLFWCAAKKRYEALSALSQQLDQILHSQQALQFVPDEEGELALLSSEIQKLTLRLTEQAEEMQRDKEYLKDSIADISHQIRTPLTAIRLLLSRLQRREACDGKEIDMECIREIRSLLSRMEWQVSVLLKIARLESGTIVMEENEVSVARTVEKAWEPLVILADIKEIALRTDVPEHISFRGDESWTVEAVGNLLKNCAEHLQKGGCLWITAAENPLYTELTVADNGPGILPEQLPHLFERFYRGNISGDESSGAGEHAGIGLALAQMIIRAQNGTIEAMNRPGGGAKFQIRFYKGVI